MQAATIPFVNGEPIPAEQLAIIEDLIEAFSNLSEGQYYCAEVDRCPKK